MSLCPTCTSLPLLTIPKIPPSFDAYAATNITPILVQIRKRRIQKTEAGRASVNDDPGLPFHASLDELALAARKCAICKVVQRDVEQFQAEYPKAQEEGHPRARDKGPGWRMWVAKSQNNESSAFMVVSLDAENENVLWIVSAVGLSVDDNDPMSSVVSGRKIEADPLSDTTVGRALSWMRECDEHEGPRCAVAESTLPSKLLNVRDAEFGEVSLHASSGEKGKYAALSHVRDDGYPITVSKESSNANDSISLETLPKVYRDAITMTRKLGLQYLWVEALCAQSALESDTLPSPNTASICANAHVTLSALGSSSGTDGMLTQRTPPSYNSFPYTHDKSRGTIYACSTPKEPMYYYGNDRILRHEPLSQQGWALQDRIFSPRILHFGTSQLFFECNTHFISEDGFKMDGRSDTLNEAALSTSRPHSPATPWSTPFVAAFWQTIVSLYSRRSLPDPNDKLPALSSIAAHIASKTQDTYIAGLWRETLLDDLIWQATGHARGLTSDPPSYRAPSWSWASIDGPFGAFCRGQGSEKGGYMEGVTWSDTATILDVSVTPKGSDLYGEVTDAWIKLRAPLEKLEQCGNWQTTKQVWKLKTKNGKEEGTICILDTKARADEAEGKEVFALVLVKNDGGGMNLHYHGIVVTKVEEREGTYRRVGKALFDEETLGKCEWMEDEGKMVEVTIV